MTQPNPNAILGDFHALRTTQSEVFITVAVPLEDMPHVVALLGAPDRAKGNPVAIAALKPEALQEAPSEPVVRVSIDCTPPLNPDGSDPRNVGYAPKEHRKWGELPRSQRAALLIKDEGFQEWVDAGSANLADMTLKHHCGIQSKTELDTDPDAAAAFDAWERDWLAFKKLPPVTAYESEVR